MVRIVLFLNWDKAGLSLSKSIILLLIELQMKCKLLIPHHSESCIIFLHVGIGVVRACMHLCVCAYMQMHIYVL